MTTKEILNTAAHQIACLWEGYNAAEDRAEIEEALVEIGLAKAGTVKLWNCGIRLDDLVEPGADIEFETVDGEKGYAVVTDLISGRARVRIGRELTLSMFS